MNKYRSHNCSELREKDIGKNVKISGWLHRKRDHGNLLFLDIRDHFGITQCVTDMESEIFKAVENLRVESVITVTGKLIQRSDDTINKKMLYTKKLLLVWRVISIRTFIYTFK